jgi:hypothetical protein
VTGRRQIDDGEAPMTQGNAGVLVRPHAGAVRTAMGNPVGHRGYGRDQCIAGQIGIDKTTNAAHAVLLFGRTDMRSVTKSSRNPGRNPTVVGDPARLRKPGRRQLPATRRITAAIESRALVACSLLVSSPS